MKSALVQSLDGRVGAYRAEVQRMMDADPSGGDVDVGALYVLKDSLGAMFESAGMYQEACNEYSELEAMIENCVGGRSASMVGNEGEVDERGEGGDIGHGEIADSEGRVSPSASEGKLSYQTECSISQVAVCVLAVVCMKRRRGSSGARARSVGVCQRVTGGPARFASGECAHVAGNAVIGWRPLLATLSHCFACSVAAPYSC